jgi:hypothetical protein
MKTPPLRTRAGANPRVLAARPTLSPPRLLQAAVPLLLALLLLATLAGCGGGLLGGGGTDDRVSRADIRGEVERVETAANEIDLWTDDRRLVTIDYDEDTPVYYEGQLYEPENLEAGDVIVVDAVQSAGGWVAQRIDVERGAQDRVGGDDDRYDDEPYDEDARVTTLTGEVREVDTRDREIELSTEHGVQTFHYRSGTVVYYQGDRYEVSNLEPGDVIRTRVERDSRGDYVTDSITVERSVQERTGGVDDRDDDRNAEGRRYAGTVEEVDSRRGEFVLRTERYGTQTVVMPYDASTTDRREFEDLRRGDYVRLEGEPVQSGRIELRRFGWSAS